MCFVVETVRVIDRAYRNGDAFWDGDQTLYELIASEAPRRATFRVVVPRGDAFISANQLKRFVERSLNSIDDLKRRERVRLAGGRREVSIEIVPADVAPVM